MPRLSTERPIATRVAVIAGGLLLSGYGVVRLVGGSPPDGPPVPPPEADDPLNPVILIEGGRFMAGNEHAGDDGILDGPRSTVDEGVSHWILDSFWMQRHEVTNEEYSRFDPSHEFPAGEERHPVVNVTWEEALAYARSLGGRLPSEAQWEYAARGAERREYPWGDEEPTCEHAHYRACEPRGTLEVLSLPGGATPEGVHGLAGSVWEWVTPNWFEKRMDFGNDETRRMRGGSFEEDEFFLRAANRNKGFFTGFRWNSVGFRVVWPLD